MHSQILETVVLVDMDGVITDFDGHFDRLWSSRFPERPRLPQQSRTRIRIVDEYPPEYRADIEELFSSPGFYLGMSPLPGALDALKDMAVAGLDVWICTSPLKAFRHCVAEKYDWVEKHLGTGWVSRLILTRNKGLIQGRYLIDDLPELLGQELATWELLLLDAPCNRMIHHPKRMTWDSWRRFIEVPS